jgi:hypothetical protein
VNYDVIDYGGNLYYTGNLKPSVKACKVKRWPVQQFNRSTIEGLIKDPSRVKAADMFGPEWIYNQGSIGSCNGCAGAKALQRQRVLAGQPNIELSGEYLYSRINGSRDVGSMLDAGMEWIQSNGVAPWRPQHAQKYRSRDFTAEDVRDSVRFKGLECYGIDSELELATGIALGFTAVVAVHATNNFMRLDANGIAGGGNGPGNHAVGVDDVKIINGELVFRMFNSWGKSYGDNGYAGLTWNRHFKTTNKYHYFYLIRSVNDDTQDNVPELKQ